MLKLVSHFGGSTSRFIHEGDFIYLSFGPEFAILYQVLMSSVY